MSVTYSTAYFRNRLGQMPLEGIQVANRDCGKWRSIEDQLGGVKSNFFCINRLHLPRH